MRKILFVCKHNRFRSKVAEAFFNKLNKNKDYVASSAGLLPGGYPLDKLQVKIAREFGIELKGKPQSITTNLLMWMNLMVIVADNVPCEIFKNQKIDAPPRTKVRGLIGARFLDARSVPRSKERGFQTLRHKKYGREEIVWKIEDEDNGNYDDTYKIIKKIEDKVRDFVRSLK